MISCLFGLFFLLFACTTVPNSIYYVQHFSPKATESIFTYHDKYGYSDRRIFWQNRTISGTPEPTNLDGFSVTYVNERELLRIDRQGPRSKILRYSAESQTELVLATVDIAIFASFLVPGSDSVIFYGRPETIKYLGGFFYSFDLGTLELRKLSDTFVGQGGSFWSFDGNEVIYRKAIPETNLTGIYKQDLKSGIELLLLSHENVIPVSNWVDSTVFVIVQGSKVDETKRTSLHSGETGTWLYRFNETTNGWSLVAELNDAALWVQKDSFRINQIDGNPTLIYAAQVLRGSNYVSSMCFLDLSTMVEVAYSIGDFTLNGNRVTN